MNISVFGLGYVGCVSLGCLAQNGHNVIGVDTNPIKVEQINSGKATIIEKDIDRIIGEQHLTGRIRATMDFNDAIQNSEISIICVGTPSSGNGHLNLNYIMKVASQIGESLKGKNEFHILAVRSTVMPGTADKIADIIEEQSGKKRNEHFSVLSNPEFLREGTAVIDYYDPPITLIGTDNNEAAQKLASLYAELPAEIIITDLKVAEIMKYVNNTYHALKVSFGNEIGNICKSLSIDSHKVVDIFCKDKKLNISPYYFKPGFAFGGSCLPKDLKGLGSLAHDLYLETPVIQNIEKSNEIQIKRTIDYLVSLGKKRIGFLGISFKEGTDDLRNSPALTVIETLLGKGFSICIYDKNVRLAQLTGTNKQFIDERIPHLANYLTDDLESVIEGSDIIVITTKEKIFIEKLKYVEEKHLVDLVRLDDSLLNKSNYFGINW